MSDIKARPVNFDCARCYRRIFRPTAVCFRQLLFHGVSSSISPGAHRKSFVVFDRYIYSYSLFSFTRPSHPARIEWWCSSSRDCCNARKIEIWRLSQNKKEDVPCSVCLYVFWWRVVFHVLLFKPLPSMSLLFASWRGWNTCVDSVPGDQLEFRTTRKVVSHPASC